VNTHPSSLPGRPRSTEADQAILGAAIKLLKEQGYARMSVEAVAAEAGVGKTTIYRRHENKEELVVAALETIVHQPEVPDSGSTRDDLHKVLSHFHSHVITKLGTSTLGTLMVEEEHHPQFLKRFRRQIVQPRRDVFRAILRRGVERGELRPDIDLEMTVDFLTGGMVMRRLTTGKTSSRFVTQAIDALWPGIAGTS
jgi:AcrR family transcriptional regulator